MTAPKLPFTPRLFAVDSFSGAKAQNAAWLAAAIDYTSENSFPADRNCLLRLSFSVVESVVVEVTYDNGSTWGPLYSGQPLQGEQILDVVIGKTSQFNVRTPTAGGATLINGRVSLVLGEG